LSLILLKAKQCCLASFKAPNHLVKLLGVLYNKVEQSIEWTILLAQK